MYWEIEAAMPTASAALQLIDPVSRLSFTVSLLVLSGVAAVWLLAIVRIIQLHRAIPHIEASPAIPSGDAPMISVIVPARNEERHIGRCLKTWRNQTYPNYEVIVVDDASTDSTSRIVETIMRDSAGITLLRNDEPPPGWIGKSWASHRGARLAQGEYLLFTDADTTVEPEALDSALEQTRRHDLAILTLIPRIRCESFWSNVVMPVLNAVISLIFPAIKVNDYRSRTAYVFGSFFLVKRAAYEQVGGHEAVREAVVEDRALGERVKGLGFGIRMIRGERLVSSVWSRDFKSVWEGLQRLISSSVQGSPLSGLGFAAATFMLGVLPFITLAFLTFQASTPGNQVLLGLSLTAVLLVLTFQAIQILFILKLNMLYILAAPLGALVFTAAMVSTVYRTSTGRGFRWKGRAYHPRHPPTPLSPAS